MMTNREEAERFAGILRQMKPGQRFNVTFKPGQGRKGKIDEGYRVSLIRFIAMSAEQPPIIKIDDAWKTLVSCAVVPSSSWEMIDRNITVDVLATPDEDKVFFYSWRIPTAIESITEKLS